MGRLIGGLLLGTLAAFVSVFLIEWIGHFVFPLPSDLALEDPESLERALGGIPLPLKLIVAFAWFAGATDGAWVAMRMSRRSWVGWAVAAIVAVAALANVLMIPHPVWMQIAAVAAPLCGGLLAHHLPPAGRKQMEARNARP